MASLVEEAGSCRFRPLVTRFKCLTTLLLDYPKHIHCPGTRCYSELGYEHANASADSVKTTIINPQAFCLSHWFCNYTVIGQNHDTFSNCMFLSTIFDMSICTQNDAVSKTVIREGPDKFFDKKII